MTSPTSTPSIVASPQEHSAGFNPAINGFRGLCALSIFVFHVFNAGIVAWPSETPFEQAVVYLFGTLRFGVEMFFMISGFVIVGSLVRHASLERFYFDRFIRIFALWLPLALVICALGPLAGWRVFEGAYDAHWLLLAVANLLLLPPIIPMASIHPASWSLSYEWLFYLCAGLVWWVARSGLRRSALALALALFAFALIAIPRSAFFATGVIVFLAQERLPALHRWLRYPFLSLAVFLLAWGATDAGIVSPFYEVEAWSDPAQWACTILAFVAALHCFACIAARRAFLSRILELKVFQFLGDISFSLYLVSGMVMFAVKKLSSFLLGDIATPAEVLVVFGIASLLLSLSLSWLTRIVLERKFAGVMRRSLLRFVPAHRLRPVTPRKSTNISTPTPIPVSGGPTT